MKAMICMMAAGMIAAVGLTSGPDMRKGPDHPARKLAEEMPEKFDALRRQYQERLDGEDSQTREALKEMTALFRSEAARFQSGVTGRPLTDTEAEITADLAAIARMVTYEQHGQKWGEADAELYLLNQQLTHLINLVEFHAVQTAAFSPGMNLERWREEWHRATALYGPPQGQDLVAEH